MVKSVMRGKRSLAKLPLNLECEKDALSPAQINHRKRKLEDFQLLKAALQASGLRGNDSSPLPNGLPLLGLSAIPALADTVSLPQTITNGPLGPQGPFMQYVMPNSLNASTKGKSHQSKGKGAGSKAALIQNGMSVSGRKNPVSSSTPIMPKPLPKPTLTQSLRATRKTTGSLPPPRVNLSESEHDDDIEVIQETRVPGSQKPMSQTSVASMTAGSSKTSQTKPVNNTLLLNISVRPRNLAPVSVNSSQRKELDAKVKTVLMKTPSEFVEWLLHQGLIRPQQYCSVHKTANRQATKLKLGVFSEPKILTSSGGYVWIGECCGRKYVSVYSGSIFGSTPIDRVSPTSLLKLVYHWSCQTSISNVETWVKVDKSFVSKIYHYLRCVCSVILHDKVYDFGFEFSKVELGIVSLGTTTADGSRKAVKVEILGLYDRKMKSYRLFASTPEPGNTSKERFLRILKPIIQVVHRNAIIVCDQSVDPSCLHSMNYSKVEVCTSSDDENDSSCNATIMFYLRKHVPKMFQSALSQLSENQVQLILDELCWREKFASTTCSCFDNILENIFYITSRELENPGVLPLLEYVADNPHNSWRYKSQSAPKVIPTVPASVILPPTNGPPNVVPSQYMDTNPIWHSNKVMTRPLLMDGAAPTAIAPSIQPSVISSIACAANSPIRFSAILPNVEKSPSQRSQEYTDLEPYFYGRITGNPGLGQEVNACEFQCHLCLQSFSDNISFYSHLKFHLENKPVDIDKVDLVCPFCTLCFDNINALNKHKIDSHLMSDLTQVWCRICAEKFANEHMLKTHMMRKHVEAELPYRCDVCHFATSFYYEVINHFTKAHKGSPYVQCHYCLSVKAITPDGSSSFSLKIMQHLQKHAVKNPCRNCLLDFYSKHFLDLHKKEHLSCANYRDLIRYESPKGYRVLQFKLNLGVKSLTPTVPTERYVTPSKSQGAMSVVLEDQSDVKLTIGDDKYYCIECDEPIAMDQHLRRYRKCTRCPYSTSCQSTILKHVQIFHPSGTSRPIPYMLGHPVVLPNPMYCICGFSTLSGHHLARHLAMCKRTTAYPINYETYTLNQQQLSLNDFKEELMDVDDGVPPLPVLPLSVELQEG